jgi:hypothetical protein
MLRIVALDVVLFLLPFAAYALWLAVTRRTLRNPDDWQIRTITWLALAGAALVVVVIVVFIHFDPSPPGGTYVPPHIENGVIVPGHIDPPAGGG